tara:strand:+ start:498 stop:812 length:315 start_codon:yes stop_codon:yes gene_type:complete
MNLIDCKDHLLIDMEKGSLKPLINTLKQPSIEERHIIINVLNTEIDHDLLVNNLLPFHFSWQKRNKSFILVSNIRKDSIKQLISVPTLQEAVDFFQMEQLTRII